MRMALGALCVLLGAFLACHPFASLAVLLLAVIAGLALTGVAELVSADSTPHPPLRLARGLAYLLALVAVAIWPGATLGVLAVVVGVALISGGALDLVEAYRSTGMARWNAALGGAASIIFGGLVLLWPDVSVLVIAVVFGARMVMFGVRQIVAVVRLAGRPEATDEPLPDRRGGAGWRGLGLRLLALLVAGILVLVGTASRSGAPIPDDFYHPPADVAGVSGQLLRAESFTRAVPTGAVAWRILYTTTRDDGVPAVASGLVVAPSVASAEPRPVVAWAHGTTGAAPGCAPSLLANPFEDGAMFVLDQVVARGWVLVATDYVGLGTDGPHPYLVGQGEARSVLDSVRAARQLAGLTLSDSTVVWGHSQGGHAALWTGVLGPAYAPDVSLSGVAAMAPASNLPRLIDNLAEVTGGSLLGSFMIDSYAATYPDVVFEDYVRPGAQIIVRESAARCLGEPGLLLSAASSLFLDQPIWRGHPNRGTLQARLEQNVPRGPISAPLLLAQGGADGLVIPAAQDAYVDRRCQAGYRVDYRSYPGRDHVALVEAESQLIPELLAWTGQRLSSWPTRNTCPR